MSEAKIVKGLLLCFIVFLGSMVGGFVSDRLSKGKAFADEDSRKIRASGFFITDKDGDVRSGLGFDNDGNPVLVFQEKSGMNRSYFGLGKQGPIMGFCDDKGSTRILLRTTKDGSSTIGIVDDDNHPQVMMRRPADKDASFAIFDKQGKGRLALALSNGNPGLAFLDSRQQSQLLIQARDGQGALVSLHDGRDEPAVAMGLREGRSFVYAYDRDKSGFFAGAQSGKGPALALKERGKVAWAAGAGGDVKALEQGLDAAGFGMDLLR